MRRKSLTLTLIACAAMLPALMECAWGAKSSSSRSTGRVQKRGANKSTSNQANPYASMVDMYTSFWQPEKWATMSDTPMQIYKAYMDQGRQWMQKIANVNSETFNRVGETNKALQEIGAHGPQVGKDGKYRIAMRKGKNGVKYHTIENPRALDKLRNTIREAAQAPQEYGAFVEITSAKTIAKIEKLPLIPVAENKGGGLDIGTRKYVRMTSMESGTFYYQAGNRYFKVTPAYVDAPPELP